MQLIDAARALEILDYRELVESMRADHEGPASLTDDIYLEEPGASAGRNGFLVRPAWQFGEHLGAKLATVFPENPDRGMLTVQAVYVLFDGSNGAPVAVIDGTVLTWFKTACDSALAASYLAPDDAATLTMVGAGAMAPHLVRAHVAVRPSIRSVSIWNRTRSSADAVAGSLDIPGVTVEVVGELPGAVRGADVVCVATRTQDPVVFGEHVSEGTHLDLVGSYTPEMREVDDAAIRRGRMFVDLEETAILTGELLQPIASGAMTVGDIAADLYGLCQGRHPGRTGPAEITIFKNGGGGHLDLMTACHIMAKHGQADD